MATKQTPEEMMIEIAILKNNDQVRKLLKEELTPLKKEIETLDSRLKAVEDKVESLSETVQPFTVFRRRMWQALIFFTLGTASVAFIVYEINQFKGN